MVTGILPCAAVIPTVAAGGRRDAMTATAVFVSEDRPLVSVSVAEHLLTHDLIEEAGEFVAYGWDKERGPLVWHQGRYFALGTPLA